MEINEALILNSGEGKEIKVGNARLFLKLLTKYTMDWKSIGLKPLTESHLSLL